MVAARREAADTVMKIYVQAMHKALGFGADRVAVVVEETEGNFRQFGECTKDGEYYGYAVLAPAFFDPAERGERGVDVALGAVWRVMA